MCLACLIDHSDDIALLIEIEGVCFDCNCDETQWIAFCNQTNGKGTFLIKRLLQVLCNCKPDYTGGWDCRRPPHYSQRGVDS